MAETRAALSRVVRAARRQHGLSQRALARQVGVSQSSISRAESGACDLGLGLAATLLAAIGSGLIVHGDRPSTRSSGEHVRDQQGRRLPAHLPHYRLHHPHTWWYGWYVVGRPPAEPAWSFHRPGTPRRRTRPTQSRGGDSSQGVDDC